MTLTKRDFIFSICAAGVILGLLMFKFDVALPVFTKGTLTFATERDIADLFVLPGQKYNIKEGVVYDCFTGNVMHTFRKLNKTVDFISEIKKTTIEDTKRQEEFQRIFDTQVWTEKGPVKDKMSPNYLASGSGSTLETAQSPLALLNSVIERLKTHLDKHVISMVDIPCGDFHWMRELVGRRADVTYTGIDIVPTLIERHRKNNAHMKNAKFVHMDIVKQKLNESYDIIFSRDMLQHLPNADVMQVLDHFSSSGSKLLVTTHLKGTESRNIKAGGFRNLNLMLPPINLTPPLCEIDETGNKFKHLAIWKLPLKQT